MGQIKKKKEKKEPLESNRYANPAKSGLIFLLSKSIATAIFSATQIYF